MTEKPGRPPLRVSNNEPPDSLTELPYDDRGENTKEGVRKRAKAALFGPRRGNHNAVAWAKQVQTELNEEDKNHD